MKIAILVEGKTETAFMTILRTFLQPRLERMPRLHPIPYDGRIPKEEKLRRVVDNLLDRFDVVIALTDVYTGTRDFADAADAKEKMKRWWETMPSFTLTQRSMILKLGSCLFGPQFSNLLSTTKQRLPATQNLSIITVRHRIALRRSLS